MDRRPTVLIAANRHDLHAYIIKRCIDEDGSVGCRILESDAIAGNGLLSWELGNLGDARLPTSDGGTSVADVDVIWWRRSGTRQSTVPETADIAHRDLIDNDCHASMSGILATVFQGSWIDHPQAARQAENKLVQLSVARRLGWRVPETVVTQDPAVVDAFRGRHSAIVVKAVKGTRHAHIPTRLVGPTDWIDPGSVVLSPTIYQEFIPGEVHFRVLVFGTVVLATRIESPDVDWRWNLDVPFSAAHVSDEIVRRLVATLRELNLTMGVFDLKVVGDDGTADDDFVWLEVNPQGQFLFTEGLTAVSHAQPFATYLQSRAKLAFERKS